MTTPLRWPALETFSWQERVLGFAADPPASPDKGDRYVIEATATGAWEGHEDSIAWWDGSAWRIDGPFNGWMVYNLTDQQVYKYHSEWVLFPSEYSTETVSLGGDFGSGSGSEVKCVRVGDQVTITLLGNLTHASSAAPDSAASPIPAKYRPLHNQINLFHEDLESLGRPKALIRVTTAGAVEIRYSAAATSTPGATSITYNV